jgi:transcriptional regulator with XRE-family HTH domain
MERIKRVRKSLGLTLRQVAERSGLLPEGVARAERKGQDVRASTVAAIARAMGVPVCELFEESGHERKRKRTSRSKEQ